MVAHLPSIREVPDPTIIGTAKLSIFYLITFTRYNCAKWSAISDTTGPPNTAPIFRKTGSWWFSLSQGNQIWRDYLLDLSPQLWVFLSRGHTLVCMPRNNSEYSDDYSKAPFIPRHTDPTINALSTSLLNISQDVSGTSTQ